MTVSFSDENTRLRQRKGLARGPQPGSGSSGMEPSSVYLTPVTQPVPGPGEQGGGHWLSGGLAGSLLQLPPVLSPTSESLWPGVKIHTSFPFLTLSLWLNHYPLLTEHKHLPIMAINMLPMCDVTPQLFPSVAGRCRNSWDLPPVCLRLSLQAALCLILDVCLCSRQVRGRRHAQLMNTGGWDVRGPLPCRPHPSRW